MQREIRDWKRGRKRSILPAVVAVLAAALLVTVWYAERLSREAAVKEELLKQLAGDYIVTELLYAAGEEAQAQLPMELVITEQGGVTLDGEELFAQSAPTAESIGRKGRKEFRESFAGRNPELKLAGEDSYIITFPKSGKENFVLYYTDGRIWLTPDGSSLYEVKTN
ncbi:MAG: hypothetical protein J6B85_06125 [Lachnospiraceae bacterium]|nr:hypothetical protein [Lachnospiraceae bacterium]